MFSRSVLGLAAALLIASASIASAQTSPTPAAPPAAKAAAKTTVTKTKVKTTTKVAKPRSEISIACSAKATEQGLTGKKRRAFRKTCMKQKAA